MKNPLVIWKENKQKKEVERKQNLKDRILKNKEAVLDVMSSNIEGAHQCPFLLGQKCIGQLCEMFMEFKTVNDVTKEEFKYYRCAVVQIPTLLIEVIQELVRFNKMQSGINKS